MATDTLVENLLRNSLVFLAGLVVGSAVNMGLIMLGSAIVPAPEGVDVTSMESLRASMHLFEPHHFVFPFLGHALGTLVGAALVARLAISSQFGLAMAIGVLFFIGGVTNILQLGGPIWFNAIDLILAYLPMAWLGAKIAKRVRSAPENSVSTIAS